eukprot:3798940-Prymnesium_polylepis.1
MGARAIDCWGAWATGRQPCAEGGARPVVDDDSSGRQPIRELLPLGGDHELLATRTHPPGGTSIEQQVVD